MIKNSHGELESVSKEDHPIHCPLEIDVRPFCSKNIQSPPSIPSIEDLPNLKDLFKQRESICSRNSSMTEVKRSRLERKSLSTTTINTHGEYRLFAVINHHGGSSDVGKTFLSLLFQFNTLIESFRSLYFDSLR